MSWNKAWDYVSGFLREPSSHLSSAMAGDLYVPDAGERAVWDVFEMWRNSQPGAKRRKLKRPWAGNKPTYRDAPVMDEARKERRERLAGLF